MPDGILCRDLAMIPFRYLAFAGRYKQDSGQEEKAHDAVDWLFNLRKDQQKTNKLGVQISIMINFMSSKYCVCMLNNNAIKLFKYFLFCCAVNMLLHCL